MFVYDLKTRRTVYNNPQVVDILGWTKEEMAEADPNFYEQLLPADVYEKFANWEQLVAGIDDQDIFELVHRIQHKDGSWRWLQSRYTLFKRDTDGTPWQLIGISQDVTEQKHNQEKLRQRNKELAALTQRMV